MALIYGQPGPEWGDQQVYESLRYLPEDCIVYAQPILVHKQERRHPDYVIVHPAWGGVIVLEVKDWVKVVDRDRHSATVQRANGQTARQGNPLIQVRAAAQVLSNMLENDKELQDYAGGRDYTYAYGCIFPHFPRTVIQWLEEAWGESYLLGRDDLGRDQIDQKITGIYVPPGARRGQLTERQVRAMYAIIDGRNKNVGAQTGEFKGVYDRVQESIYKEPIAAAVEQPAKQQSAQVEMQFEPAPSIEARLQTLENEIPQEAWVLKSAQHVRLVRGFASTGKTDVLILRVHFLREQYPELDILVTTFNDPVYKNRLEPELRSLKPKVDIVKFDTLCAGIYKFGTWEAERQFVSTEINGLIQEQGVLPAEIGILHEKPYVLDRYRSIVPKGVQLYEIKRQTRLEYKVVFVPKVQDMVGRNPGSNWQEEEGRQRLKFYMTMTRARQQVHLLYQQKWPTLLEPIRPHVTWLSH